MLLNAIWNLRAIALFQKIIYLRSWRCDTVKSELFNLTWNLYILTLTQKRGWTLMRSVYCTGHQSFQIWALLVMSGTYWRGVLIQKNFSMKVQERFCKQSWMDKISSKAWSSVQLNHLQVTSAETHFCYRTERSDGGSPQYILMTCYLLLKFFLSCNIISCFSSLSNYYLACFLYEPCWKTILLKAFLWAVANLVSGSVFVQTSSKPGL